MTENKVYGVWEVRAGIILGTPVPEYTKRFRYTTAMREDDYVTEKETAPFSRLNHYCCLQAEAMAYFRQLNDASILNWAEITWIWF